MVKCRRRPSSRAVAVGTQLIEIIRHVIWINHSREILRVAAITRLTGADIRLRMAGNALK